MSFPRYPRYKDSGVEWLGQVPEHWTAKPIRLAAKLESGHTPSRSHPEFWENCTIPWISLSDVSQFREGNAKYIYETKEKISELGLANSSARLLPRNTVILSRTASVGFSAIMGTEMATTQDFANWICGKELLPEFLLNVFRSMEGEFRRLMMGSTHNTIYMPDIQSLRFVQPPISEQTQIATFLDHETAKIDALVAEQRRLIELLKEKRQAVISHAVTKGLDPNVPMKPSGVEWLGEVPAHWEVRRIKSVSNFVTSGPRGWGENVGAGGAIFIQSGDLDASLGVVFAEAKRVQVELDAEAARTRLENGDVVVCITGAKTGNVAVCTAKPGEAYINQHLCLVRPNFDILPIYLGISFKSRLGQTHFELSQYGLKQGLSLEDVKETPVLLPTLSEQTAIVTYLGDEVPKIDLLSAEAERAIDLLQERRTALISAAVTGQIDVRGLVESPAP